MTVLHFSAHHWQAGFHSSSVLPADSNTEKWQQQEHLKLNYAQSQCGDLQKNPSIAVYCVCEEELLGRRSSSASHDNPWASFDEPNSLLN